MPGPRSRKIVSRDKKKSIKFQIEKKGISVVMQNKAVGVVAGMATSIFFTDSQVRKLRDWLNWYLDNK